MASGDQDLSDAITIVNELPHLAGAKGWPGGVEFDDYHLAQAIRKTSYGSKFSMSGNFEDRPGYLKKFPKGPKGPINPFEAYPDPKTAWKNRYSNRWSTYVHDILNQNCKVGG